MTEELQEFDIFDVDTEILERIRAWKDAKNQAQQADSVGWVDQDTLDYSLRGIEVFDIR